MDDTTQTAAQHPASDDQELAKVLAGVDAEAKNIDGAATPSGLHFEDTPGAPNLSDDPDPVAPPAPVVSSDPTPPAPASEPVIAPLPTPAAEPAVSSAPAASPELESLKKDAIEELKPLVSKLNLPAEEKFNTILLIIRSTDDQSLLGPAHEAAKTIEDEAKRAQALLDVIKEIDFFSSQSK